jgi:hypothetical protein
MPTLQPTIHKQAKAMRKAARMQDTAQISTASTLSLHC